MMTSSFLPYDLSVRRAWRKAIQHLKGAPPSLASRPLREGERSLAGVEEADEAGYICRLPGSPSQLEPVTGGGGPSRAGSATSRRGGDPPSGKVLGPKDTSKPLSTCPHFWSQVAQVHSETEKWFSISSKKDKFGSDIWFGWTTNFSAGLFAYISAN